MNDGKKIKYNLIVGVLGQAIALVLGVLLPKLVITSYGSEVNGLLSSVTNIYAYIALVEAGVAAASCQALYKPIAQQDRDSINAVLAATNKYYHRSGLGYLGLIVAFAVIYPILIQTEIPYYTIALVILLNGIGNVINYFFHGKYLILLKADGKNFVRTGLETFTNAFKQISKIVLIQLGYDVVFVQLAAMLVSFVQMGYITYYIKTHYSWLDLKVKPDKKAISQSKNVLVHEVNYLITSNVDTVLLTVFQTLKTVSVYSLYNLLFDTINRLLRVIRDSVEFKLAHLFHKDRQAFQKMYYAFEIYYITLAFTAFSITNYFILPFITLYTADVTDINYVIPAVSILFVLINLLSAGRYPSDAMIHIAGHFEQTQTSAVIETVLNAVISVILVPIMGIEGALLGTVISSLYRTNYLIIYVNKNILKRKMTDTYLCWGVNFCVFLFTMFINQFIVINLGSYTRVFAFCIPYAIGTALLYFLVVSMCMKRAFRSALSVGRTMIKNKKLQ